MKNLSLFLLLLFSSVIVGAQGVISGSIKDAETGQPLEGASVFAQNTTRGVITDKEGNFKIFLEKGGYEINISFTGYVSKTINLEVTGDRQFDLKLEKGDNTMGEVIIKSSNELADGWERYGDFFLDHFIGSSTNADSCFLVNPEALRFLYYKRNDRLKILASEPLQIVNKSLGYHIQYELDSFVYFFKTDMNSYRGKVFYREMEGDSLQLEAWAQSRKAAYEGSRLHFLRAYYTAALDKEGFTVDLFTPSSQTSFARIRNPYDTAYYYFDDSTGNAELYFPVKATIAYQKKAPESRYLTQYNLPTGTKAQVTFIDMRDVIYINPNGYFTDQKNLVNQGYWSWLNVADQLPLDYNPDQRRL